MTGIAAQAAGAPTPHTRLAQFPGPGPARPRVWRLEWTRFYGVRALTPNSGTSAQAHHVDDLGQRQ